MANIGKYGGKGTGKSGMKWTRSQYSPTGLKTWRIEGIENVSRNINLALMKMKGKSAAGFTLAAKLILNDADSGTSPLVPEETGDLRSSRFQNTLKKPVSGDPYVRFGYSKNYAAAVHEMMESPSGLPINWTRPGSGPKFLESSLKRNTEKALMIIANSMKK